MNRRGFLSAMIRAGVGAMVLPGAVTYARRWKRDTIWVVNPAWENAPLQLEHCFSPAFNPADYQGEWSFIPSGITMVEIPGKEVKWETTPLRRYEMVNGVFKRVEDRIEV